ncbi:MAG TPA: M20/M25/M40 family metallo-hydrolase [Candidatus Udaeobacter sp.]|nr:M20/M25/M40 family metallo-hydrolase [Candidatus Udaeobacter sp.]
MACALALIACAAAFGMARAGAIAAAMPSRAHGTPKPSVSAVERRLVRSIARQAPSSMDLLIRAVNVNSGTMNFDGVRAVARLFEPELQSLGFTCRWADGAGFGRAGHLIARRVGRGDVPKLVLIGHLDTVFERDSPFQRFEPLPDSTARGPGVIDMKGGDVIMLMALRALADAGRLDRLSIAVVLSGDEENAGTPLALARHDLEGAADWADVALGFEDAAGDPSTAVVARRGAGSWTVRASGRPGHSSQIFRDDMGDGAIYELARILAAFRDSLSHERYLTVNPGLIVGGSGLSLDSESGHGAASGKSNVIAESSAVSGDLRSLSLDQRERARTVMSRIVAAHLPHTDARITFEDGYPPLAPSAGNRRLLSLFDQVSRDLGDGPVTAVDPARAGAADISFTEGRVEMALDGLGLMGHDDHSPGETADLRTFTMQAGRVAVLLSRLADWRRGEAAP